MPRSPAPCKSQNLTAILCLAFWGFLVLTQLSAQPASGDPSSGFQSPFCQVLCHTLLSSLHQNSNLSSLFSKTTCSAWACLPSAMIQKGPAVRQKMGEGGLQGSLPSSSLSYLSPARLMFSIGKQVFHSLCPV